MLKLILNFFDQGKRALEQGVYLKDIEKMEVRNKIARAKYIAEEDLDKIDDIDAELIASVDNLISKGGILNA